MNVFVDCPLCDSEALFEVDREADELACTSCSTRVPYAPDPVAAFALLYEPVQAAA